MFDLVTGNTLEHLSVWYEILCFKLYYIHVPVCGCVLSWWCPETGLSSQPVSSVAPWVRGGDTCWSPWQQPHAWLWGRCRWSSGSGWRGHWGGRGSLYQAHRLEARLLCERELVKHWYYIQNWENVCTNIFCMFATDTNFAKQAVWIGCGSFWIIALSPGSFPAFNVAHRTPQSFLVCIETIGEPGYEAISHTWCTFTYCWWLHWHSYCSESQSQSARLQGGNAHPIYHREPEVKEKYILELCTLHMYMLQGPNRVIWTNTKLDIATSLIRQTQNLAWKMK